MNAKLELYTDANEPMIFDKYKEHSPKNHERDGRAEVGTIDYNIKLQVLLLRWDVTMKNKNKRELSATCI